MRSIFMLKIWDSLVLVPQSRLVVVNDPLLGVLIIEPEPTRRDIIGLDTTLRTSFNDLILIGLWSAPLSDTRQAEHVIARLEDTESTLTHRLLFPNHFHAYAAQLLTTSRHRKRLGITIISIITSLILVYSILFYSDLFHLGLYSSHALGSMGFLLIDVVDIEREPLTLVALNQVTEFARASFVKWTGELQLWIGTQRWHCGRCHCWSGLFEEVGLLFPQVLGVGWFEHVQLRWVQVELVVVELFAC